MIPPMVHPSWHPYLEEAFNSSALEHIRTQILPKSPFYPHPQYIFQPLTMDINDIKCVILGDHPYRNSGLAYGCEKNTEPHFVLENIISEIAISVAGDIALMGGVDGEFDETLQHWHDQGVFLLNQSLTSKVSDRTSHHIYWSGFTDLIISTIAHQRPNMIWLLWGDKIYNNVSNIIESSKNPHNIFTAEHPSGGNGDNKFLGCKIFSMVNDFLSEPINWINHTK